MAPQLEIACFNVESALTAARVGADRIELGSDYAIGGTSPRKEDFKAVRAATGIPIYVLIRPRGGDFVYSDHEIEEMLRSIHEFGKQGADGFVFGCLDGANGIHERQCQMLLNGAFGLPCTFHRAIDMVNDLDKSLKIIMKIGFTSILSSGRKPAASQGLEILLKMRSKLDASITVMPGGGVRSANLKQLKTDFPVPWYHSSGIIDDTGMADMEEIKKMKSILSE